MQEHAQYAAASNVPLIKSPSLRVPTQVEMPQDIYPLPPNITEYFAYPFTLEPSVLTFEASRRAALSSQAAHHEQYLRQREEEKARRKREMLRKIAPGFEPEGGVLQPKRVGNLSSPQSFLPVPPPSAAVPSTQPRSVMDDLVDQLAAMDSRKL